MNLNRKELYLLINALRIAWEKERNKEEDALYNKIYFEFEKKIKQKGEL